MSDIAGIVLAAGRGSRMRERTEEKPKCLVELAGQSLLEWQMAALKAAGVGRVAVVRGYRAEALNGEYQAFENPRWAQTNMVASLLCAGEWLRAAPCIVSYSDIVYHPAHVRELRAAASDLAVSYDTRWLQLWGERFENPLSDAETFRVSPQGRVLEIGAKPQRLEQVQGQYMGLLKFTPQGFAAVEAYLAGLEAEQVARLDMTSLLSRLLGAGQVIEGVAVEGRWCEVDSGMDLALYESKIRDSGGPGATTWSHDWRQDWR